MKIFISWSGNRSKYIAESLSNWLEQVIQAAEPWISTDIEKGKRWSNEIATKLKESKVAIICLTNDNLDSKWIHFESGAIAKTDDAHICTFLYEISPTDVEQPLSQFQNTRFEKSDILKLIKTINTRIGETGGRSLKESNLESVFETFWPQLQELLEKVPKSKTVIKERSERDMIEESLQLLRSIKSSSSLGFLSEKDQDEIIDFWIERYSKSKKIDLTSTALNGHESLCAEFMLQIPEIKILFGTGEYLKKRIKSRISQLIPF